MDTNLRVNSFIYCVFYESVDTLVEQVTYSPELKRKRFVELCSFQVGSANLQELLLV